MVKKAKAKKPATNGNDNLQHPVNGSNNPGSSDGNAAVTFQ